VIFGVVVVGIHASCQRECDRSRVGTDDDDDGDATEVAFVSLLQYDAFSPSFFT
jgi:hypothetical protein